MKLKNVCKFIPDVNSSELKTVNFIFETDPEVQHNPSNLSGNRILLAKTDGVFIFDGKTVEIRSGDVCFAFSGETFSAEGDGLQYYYIQFKGGRSDDLYKRFGISALNRVFTGFEGLLPFWQENIARATDQNIDLVSESVLLYTFSRLTAVREPTEDVAYILTKYAEENFSDSGLSLNSAAEELGYNAKYLSTCFKQKMNIGFSEYVKTLRINNAVFLMEHGVESVKNVAFLSGFQDPLYFSKVFRETVGMPPSEYVKNRPDQKRTDQKNSD